jgi:crotonobetainyl-CoA:carnitine CoA-transferase CaiB-like acyl-CoA transferase
MSVSPLTDITVLEIGQFIAAPYAAMCLGDLGARVIKIEPPGGDAIRAWGPHPGGESGPFMAYNRGKESVVVDIRTNEGQAIVRGLLGRVDIVIENNRPGVLEKFKLDATLARAINPQLIYCSISGFGSHAPNATRAAFDLVIQAVTGIMRVTGQEGQPTVKVGVPIVDGTAALHAVMSILAALHERAITGLGATIDISLQASSMTWMMLLAAGYFATGAEPKRLGSAHPLAAPYQAFRASDGELTVAVGNDAQWQRLCVALNADELVRDPRFSTSSDRARHQVLLASMIEEYLTRDIVAVWLAKFKLAGIPAEPVNSLGEALADAALVSRGTIETFEHPLAGTVNTIGSPILIDSKRAPARRSPLLGEHTESVLQEFHLTSEVS